MTEQLPETSHEPVRKRRIGRGVSWLVLSAGALAAGIVSYFLASPYSEDGKLRQFCSEVLDGISSVAVIEKAREAGFGVGKLEDTILITVAGKRLGQSCFVTIAAGKVSDVHSVVTH